MRKTFLPILLALAGAAHAEVTITDVYATDRGGNRIAPKVGEPFCLNAILSVSGQTKAYDVAFDAPSNVLVAKNLSYGVGKDGAYWIRQGEFVPLVDAPMNVTVTTTAGTKSFALGIVPASPSGAIEAYGAQRLSGSYGTTVAFDKAATRLLTWTPVPQSGGFQSVEAFSGSNAQAKSNETAQPIVLTEAKNAKSIQASASCTTVAGSVRTNLNLLRQVPMSAIDAKDKTWLGAEARIQSTHKDIVKFVKDNAGVVDANRSIADVALSLYSAILKRSVYVDGPALPDAAETLKCGKGECGDFSALFVASCRAAGIPARPVSGFIVGTNSWHVWAEFQVPGIGWVPVDAAFALGRRAHCPTPLYFGVIPEMRDRVALVYGFKQTVGANSTTFLQTPATFATGKSLKLKSASFWCRLQAAP